MLILKNPSRKKEKYLFNEFKNGMLYYFAWEDKDMINTNLKLNSWYIDTFSLL